MSITEIKPDYYDDFHCVGSSCTFTCCQEWKIAVDKATKKKWRTIKAPAGLKETDRLPEGLTEKSSLNQFVVRKDDSDVIGLLPDMKCPFLEADHLCRLVIDHGEQVLSETCHTFPRDTHTYTDRIERTLVSCCPEIVDRWWEKPMPDFIGLDYRNKDMLRSTTDKLKQIRDLLMYHISHEETDNRTNLLKGFFILHDIYEKSGIPADNISYGSGDGSIKIDIDTYLDDSAIKDLEAAISTLNRDTEASITERNELFLDMTENYAAEGRYTSLLEPLRNAASTIDTTCYEEFLTCLKPYTLLFRNYLVAETFTSLLIPGMDLRDMVMQYEWMMMEYGIMMAALYLRWSDKCENSLDYESVREIIVLVSRLTGYDADDIEEYLTDSFESPIWDFAYADFLLG